MSLEQSLSQLEETEGRRSVLAAELEDAEGRARRATVQAKLGSMVAHQGDVKFEHAGTGGMSQVHQEGDDGRGDRT